MLRSAGMRVSSQGQVTVPAEIRRKMEIREGDLLTFIVTDERELHIERKRMWTVDELAGSVPARVEVRGDFDDEFEEAMALDLRDRIDSGAH